MAGTHDKVLRSGRQLAGQSGELWMGQPRRGLIVRASIEVAASPAPLAVWVTVTSRAWSATMSRTPSSSEPLGGPTASARVQQSSSVASFGLSWIFAKGRASTVRGSRPTGLPSRINGAKYFTSVTVQVLGL